VTTFDIEITKLLLEKNIPCGLLICEHLDDETLDELIIKGLKNMAIKKTMLSDVDRYTRLNLNLLVYTFFYEFEPQDEYDIEILQQKNDSPDYWIITDDIVRCKYILD
jgi:hypothetical protein